MNHGFLDHSTGKSFHVSFLTCTKVRFELWTSLIVLTQTSSSLWHSSLYRHHAFLLCFGCCSYHCQIIIGRFSWPNDQLRSWTRSRLSTWLQSHLSVPLTLFTLEVEHLFWLLVSPVKPKGCKGELLTAKPHGLEVVKVEIQFLSWTNEIVSP